MTALYVLQLAVLTLLVAQAWRDISWMIEILAALRAASALTPERRQRLRVVHPSSEGRALPAADVVLRLLGDARADGDDMGHEPAVAVRDGLRRRGYTLRGIARLASVTTLLSIVIELSWGLGGGSGLQALQAGLPQRLAIAQATTSLTIGAATIGLYVWLERRLRSRSDTVVRALRSFAGQLAEMP